VIRWSDLFPVVEGVRTANVNNTPVVIGLRCSGTHGIVGAVGGYVGGGAVTVGGDCRMYLWMM